MHPTRRRQWHPTPVLLPGESHGRGSLVGCHLWDRTESDTGERLHFHALEKAIATHSRVLAWRIPGTGEPSGLPSMGSHRVRHDWRDLAAAAAPNIGALQYVRQMLTIMKWEINGNTIIVGDFNTPLIPMDWSTKQQISKETQALNDTKDQLGLTDIYRTFHPKTMNFTFSSSAHRTFSRIDHILGHKSSFGKFKKIEIISTILSDINAVRYQVQEKKKKKNY